MAKDEKKKFDGWTEKEYLRKVSDLMQRFATYDNWRRVNIAEMWQIVYGKYRDESYNNLLTMHEPKDGNLGEVPFIPLNFDSISPKLSLLIGELSQRGFDFGIQVRTKKSARRKRRYIDALQFLVQMQALNRAYAQATGVEYGLNDNLPNNQEEFKKLVDQYKDIYEILMEAALKMNLEDCYYEEHRKNYMMDLLVGNEVHCKVENRNGYTYPRRVNPMYKLNDQQVNDDYFADSSADLEAYYIPWTQALEMYDIPAKELNEIREKQKKQGSKFEGWNGVGKSAQNYFTPFTTKGYDQNPDRVLIIEAEWADTVLVAKKLTYDKHGNMHYHDYTGGAAGKAKLTAKEKKDQRNQIVKKEVEVRRRCVVVGGAIVCEAGFAGNDLREFNNPLKSKSSYVSATVNYNGMQSVSLVERINELQKFKNYVATLIQKDITTYIGPGMELDASLIDKEVYGSGDEALGNILHSLKAYGVVIKNGAKAGGAYNSANGGPLARNIPVQAQSRILEYLRVIAFIDAEMDMITGINEARLGMGGEREGAQVNRARRSQSGLVTDVYFETFYAWERRVLEKMSMHIAKNWVETPELYEVIGLNLGIDIPDNFKMDLENYKSVIKTFPLTKDELEMAMRAGLESGHLPFEEYVRLRMIIHENFNLGLKKYLEYIDKRNAENAQMQQQQMQLQQQSIQMANQAKIDAAIQPAQIRRQGNNEVAQIKAENENLRKEMEVDQRDRKDTSLRSGVIEKNIIEQAKNATGRQ